MATTLHVGKSRVQTVMGSDGAPIPVGTLTAVAAQPGIVGISVNPANNEVTITGIATGQAGITYSAPGYTNAVVIVQVVPVPSIVVTDGPEF